MKYFLFLAVLMSTPFIPAQSSEFRLGIENITTHFFVPFIKKGNSCARIGLITNQSAITKKGVATVDYLAALPQVKVVYLFAPEHGIQGTIKAEKTVDGSYHQKTNASIISLYKNGSGKVIPLECLNNIDLLMFDIQDSGVRHYTYISTLYQALQIATEFEKPFVVLDRPNPLGARMEGPLVDPALQSFISLVPIPLRHGMTVGELAHLFNTHFLHKPAPLHVVPMSNYDRRHGIPRSMPMNLSPNIMCHESCFGYGIFGALGEVRPFDMHIGSLYAFQRFGFPAKMKVPSSLLHEIRLIFQEAGINATLCKYEREKRGVMKGVCMDIKNMNNVSLFSMQIKLLRVCARAGIPLNFSPAFDKAIGTTLVRECIEQKSDWQILEKKINDELEVFYRKAYASFIYAPFPIIG